VSSRFGVKKGKEVLHPKAREKKRSGSERGLRLGWDIGWKRGEEENAISRRRESARETRGGNEVTVIICRGGGRKKHKGKQKLQPGYEGKTSVSAKKMGRGGRGTWKNWAGEGSRSLWLLKKS